VVGTTLQIVGEQLCEALDLRPGGKVLDVAAGNGNVTLAAARRWCEWLRPIMCRRCSNADAERAAAERLTVDFREADAEALPFPDASFDVAVSTFGVMFTPDQDKAAAELLRVCTPRGKLALANWTARFHRPAVQEARASIAAARRRESPALWVHRARLEELFGAQASGIVGESRMFVFSLSIAGTLARRIQDVLRTNVQGVRDARPERAGGIDARSSRVGRRAQPRRRRRWPCTGEYLEAVITKR
jgi:SAM-dependent methyltransferase